MVSNCSLALSDKWRSPSVYLLASTGGKDELAMAPLARQMLMEPGSYWLCYPTLQQYFRLIYRKSGQIWNSRRTHGMALFAVRETTVIVPLINRSAATMLIVAAHLVSSTAHAEPGVFSDRIVFGQSAPFDGPASALGIEMRRGILAAFAEANAAGGLNGRRLQLVYRDDGYEPNRAIENTNRFIKDDRVFALIGEVGTPTSRAVQPIASAAGVPFIGPFSGADFLRDPSLRNVINVRASYAQETETWIEHLTTDLGFTRIALLYQDDSFGLAGRAGVVAALARRSLKLVAEGTYMRNTTAVKTALLTIRKATPQAVGMVGTYKACAEFIQLARQIGLNAVFVNISFVGPNALAKELGKDG